MKVLLDQDTPTPLRKALTGDSVETAFERGWSTLQNGLLITEARAAGFEVFVMLRALAALLVFHASHRGYSMPYSAFAPGTSGRESSFHPLDITEQLLGSTSAVVGLDNVSGCWHDAQHEGRASAA